MAITHLDGFDMDVDSFDLAQRGWEQNSASLGSPSTGRFSGRTLRITSSNSNTCYLPIASRAALTVGFAYKAENVGSYSTGGNIMSLRNASSAICVLGITSSGALKFGLGTLGTQICISAASVIASNMWNYIEVEFTRDGSAGAVNIYCNGVSVASASGTNTGASNIDSIGFNGGITNIDVDDLYITDSATRLGERRVETLLPTADSSVQWTPNASTNVSRVNTSQFDDDTTYNASSTVGHKDLFDMGNLVSSPSNIDAVKTLLSARKDDAATRTVRTNFKNGSTTTNGTSKNLSASYSIVSDIYENNPDDAAPFAAADISAMQLGYEVVA